MTKYEPLRRYLASAGLDSIPMTFSEIENIIGFRLPESARDHRAWWSNNDSNSVMTRAWLDAGYKSESVDMDAESLIFQRGNKDSGRSTSTGSSGGHREGEERGAASPFGLLVGSVVVVSGFDLTQPTDAEWSLKP